MKKKSFVKYIVPMLLVVLAATAWFGARQVAAAVQRLQKIEAEYTGMPLKVGDEINLKDITVMAEYLIRDGSESYNDYVEVKKDFTINPTVVKRGGENRVVVTYQGKSCTIMVEGKTVDSIDATYTGEELFVGAKVPEGKIEVYAYFNDGSSERVRDFRLTTDTITKEGINLIPVVYQGKTVTLTIYGKAPLAVEEIMADYTGGTVIAGNEINKKDIKVTALYNDGTTKEITSFNIYPTTVKYEGENKITVSYGEISTTIYVYGEERYITEMTAEYTGPGVIVGKKVNKEDIEVLVKYNDGKEEQTDDFELYGAEIYFEGENIVLIYCDSFSAEVTVFGVKGFAANYDNAISNSFASPNYLHRTKVTLGMNMNVEPEKFLLRPVDSDIVQYAVDRVIPTEECIGFELFYDDDEMILEFPMAMKVEVPEGFEPERFGVYYTPNKSTIMAKVDGDFVDDTKREYEFIAYEPGVYIVIHEVAQVLVTEIVADEKVELKVNRSFALNPVVFPLSADNKEVKFSSTDEDIATVSENGKIRTHSAGTCEIWIEAQDGSGVYAIVTVKVKKK
ncbi:MAG: Ig-like domain-containing protein [Lachnospiraceae bacterium]|nr:Ig-like domain-containing protein [Lachnospiraceae bacterium]